MNARQNIRSTQARTDTRHNVLIGVKLRRSGESWFASKVSDLSLTGFRVQTFVKLVVGMELWIMLPGFEGRRAQVMWVHDHEAGCNFERALHPAIFDHIVKTSRVAGTPNNW